MPLCVSHKRCVPSSRSVDQCKSLLDGAAARWERNGNGNGNGGGGGGRHAAQRRRARAAAAEA